MRMIDVDINIDINTETDIDKLTSVTGNHSGIRQIVAFQRGDN